MPRFLLRTLVYAFLSAGLWSSPARAETDLLNPPQGVFLDDWYMLRVGGQHIGYLHMAMERLGGEIHTSTKMFMAIKRAGQNLELTIHSGGRETLDGRPLAFDGRMKMAAMDNVVRGEVVNGKVRVISTQFGVSSEEEFDLPEGATMAWGIRRVTLRKGFKPGTKYAISAWEPSQSPGAVIPTTVEVMSREPLELFGQTYDAIRIRSTMNIGGTEIVGAGWYDDEGNVLRSDLQIMGMEVQQLKADRERATTWDGGGEIMIDTLVRPDRQIDSKRAQRVKYRLTLTDGTQQLSNLPTTGLQRVLQTDGRSAVLVVQRQDHEDLKKNSGTLVRPPQQMQPFLAAGPMINWQDPEVIKMATEARGDETNAYRLADKLRRYVTDVIADKNLGVGFATASEVARNREGDCSEHGVLLAALGRANGIPSRVVVGLIYVDEFVGQKGVFGFHMWTQMYVDGQWVDLDAAMRETNCNPTHIAVGTSSLQEEGLLELVGPLLKVIGNLQIEVLEVDS
ncbi:MAG: transglutaminase domain-containing protein [Phycisphaerales bacterium]|nr:MAG: transglutaminase domain-containing protein [Phycisphaerales bacterium]